ncbi:MAG: hypothetical protein ABIP95_12740 [Pelobium sp.]
MKRIIIVKLILLTFLFQSCGNKAQKTKTREATIIDTISNGPSIVKNEEVDGHENNANELDPIYPKTGITAIDFLPKSNIYEIQYEAKGDLNKDGLSDIAIVLVHKELKTAERPMLILLQGKDKSYRLDQVSKIAFPSEYNESDFKLYDTEDISIENGELHINLYGIGPSGNIFGSFKYLKNDFILTYIEAYDRGAGGSSVMVYDFSKDEITTTQTNTMEENSTPTSETKKTKKKSIFLKIRQLLNFLMRTNKSTIAQQLLVNIAGFCEKEE